MPDNIIILTTLSLAAINDYKDFKIPNWVTYPFILISLIRIFFLQMPTWELVISLLFALVIPIIPFLGQGGDRKVLMGLTLFLGFIDACIVFAITMVIAGVFILLRNKIYTKSFLPYGLKAEKAFETNIGIFFIHGYVGLCLMGVIF